MQRLSTAIAKKIHHGHVLVHDSQIIQTLRPPCDVFISHRGVETKRSVAGLLHNFLSLLGVRPFLDVRSLKPGDKLLEEINAAIYGCKVGVAVFSPRWCESWFCLHELALLVEAKKRVIPIYCDVEASQLQVDDAQHSASDFLRYRHALEEAKSNVGLSFYSSQGDWSKLVRDASDAVLHNLLEAEVEKPQL
ncbi:TIR-only protein-like [Rhodamnia argentea]|uniref:TIR-only protein-like n=1 Tax=Rhodamnia argentea TaxID=178133 RepID=A0A8B8P1T7_9MYRT|nr:TIR-only protein-like [Rhodamnia argentea]